jgi:hypothetical protein
MWFFDFLYLTGLTFMERVEYRELVQTITKDY